MMRLKVWATALGSVFLFASFGASSQAPVMPYQEYGKRLKAAEMAGPLKSDLFGESVSLYNGATEFTVVDIDIPGNSALPVRLGRRFRVASRVEPGGGGIGGFENWDLDVPFLTSYNWQNSSSTTPQRCSQFWRPYVPTGFNLQDIWHGTQMYMPGQGAQELMWIGHTPPGAAPYVVPSGGGPYYWGTRSNYRLSCLPNTNNGYPGEGFVATDTQGTRYFFDIGHEVDVGQIYKRVAATFDILTPHSRHKSYLLIRRMEDRFGNWVNYSWSGAQLQSITSNDGRSITLTRTGSTLRAETAGASGLRTWTYEFGSGRLQRVLLPDNKSKWEYSYTGLLGPNYTSTDYETAGPDCSEPFEAPDAFTLVATHPSGASGTFEFQHLRHRRSGLSADVCQWVSRDLTSNQDIYEMALPEYFDVYSLVQKRISGPGLPQPEIWNYGYEIIATGRTGSVIPGGNCSGAKSVYVEQPDGTTNEHKFGVVHGCNDGRLLETIVRDPQGRVVKSESNQYMMRAEAVQQAFPEFPFGVSVSVDDPLSNWNLPLVSSVTKQGPNVELLPFDTFNKHVDIFDALARPVQISKFNSLGYNKTDSVTYYDHLASWTIGQNRYAFTNGIETARTDFNTTTALPERTYVFGKLQQTLTYNGDGTLATVSDGRDGINGAETTVTLSNWKRGVPQSIRSAATTDSPSGATISATVSDDGTIASAVDELGSKTCYAYDQLGRLTSVSFPSETSIAAPPSEPNTCSDANWNITYFGFDPVSTEEYGVAPGHWKHTVSMGNARKVTYLDAYWRPVVEETYDAANVAGTRAITVKHYDLGGQLAFQSYPARTINDFASVNTGIRTFYDAIQRVIRTEQDSELGVLTSTMQYLDGLRTRIINPRNYTTTNYYLAWDEPGYDLLIRSEQPEGKTIEIDRHPNLGQPRFLRQRNADGSVSVTRHYVYDAHRRPCKAVEPETGATVTEYDDAGNVAWTASGLSLSSLDDCNRTEASASGRKVQRQYDGRNRLTSLSFPDALGNQSWSYWPDGKINAVTANNEGGQATNGYVYNRRRLLTSETLTETDGGVLSIGYGYDRNGSLASHNYPSGRTIDYAPNALGQSTRAGTYASGVSYYPNGAMSQFTYGNGIVHNLTQNTRGLPDRSQDVKGASVTLDDGYDYDHGGNVVAITDGAQAGRGNRDMSYDALDRLISAASPMFGTATYAYDALDNLTQVKLTSGSLAREHYYCYDATWHLANVKTGGCSGSTVIGLGYDLQGNLENKNGQRFRFDYGNRLRAATGRETYRYDGHGRRVYAYAEGQGNIASFYGFDGVLRHQRDQRQAKAIDHVYLNGSLVARVSDPVAPFTPTLAVAGYSTNGSYAVQWSAVSGATTYELQEASNGGVWQSLYSGAGLSLAVSGKSSGNYNYRVRACNTAGCGQWSVTATVAVELPPSSVPALAVPSFAASGNYTASWTTAAGASRYELEQSFNSGSWSKVYDGSAMSASFSNHPAGGYAYRVRGCNPAGCGGYSNTAMVSVVYPPGTPALTIPSGIQNSSYSVSWTAMSGATSYQLDESFNGGAWTQIHNAGANSVALTGRNSGTYRYRVGACNAAGCSATSSESAVQVLLPPGAPSISAPSSNTGGSYTVSWTNVATADSYQLEERVAGGSWGLHYNGSATSIAISGRTTGSYEYRGRACNAAGCSGYSAVASVAVTTAPSPSSISNHKHLVFYGQVVQGSCTAEWSSSAGASHYNVRVYQGGMAYSGPATYVSGGLSELYCAPRLEVQACNAAGCSAWSPPSQQTVSEEHYDDGEVPP